MFKATQLAAMQFQAMQPQAKTTATHHSKQVPKQVRILQRLLPKLGWDEAYRHKRNPSATPLQSKQPGYTDANASASQV